MSAPGESDRILAAEYVLGTLDREERRQARARLAGDPQFAALVRLWERRLSPLHELAVPVAPPPDIWPAIALDLRSAPPVPRGSALPRSLSSAEPVRRPASGEARVPHSSERGGPIARVRRLLGLAAGSRAGAARKDPARRESAKDAAKAPPPERRNRRRPFASADPAGAASGRAEAASIQERSLGGAIREAAAAGMLQPRPGEEAAPAARPDDGAARLPPPLKLVPPPVRPRPAPEPMAPPPAFIFLEPDSAPPPAVEPEPDAETPPSAAPPPEPAVEGSEPAGDGMAATAGSAAMPASSPVSPLAGDGKDEESPSPQTVEASPSTVSEIAPEASADDAGPAAPTASGGSGGIDAESSAAPEATPALDPAPAPSAEGSSQTSTPVPADPGAASLAAGPPAPGEAVEPGGAAVPEAGNVPAAAVPGAQSGPAAPPLPASDGAPEGRAREDADAPAVAFDPSADPAAGAPGGDPGPLPGWAAEVASGEVSALPEDAVDDTGEIVLRHAGASRQVPWRSIAWGLAILCVGLGAFLGYRAWVWPGSGSYVGVLQSEPLPAVIVRLDPGTGAVFVRAFAPAPASGEAYCLWVVSPTLGSRLVGRFTAGLATRVPDLAGAGRKGIGTTELLVTLEPACEAAPVAPDGKVLYRGRFQLE